MTRPAISRSTSPITPAMNPARDRSSSGSTAMWRDVSSGTAVAGGGTTIGAAITLVALSSCRVGTVVVPRRKRSRSSRISAALW